MRTAAVRYLYPDSRPLFEESSSVEAMKTYTNLGALGTLLLATLVASILNPVHATAHAQDAAREYAENGTLPVRTFNL